MYRCNVQARCCRYLLCIPPHNAARVASAVNPAISVRRMRGPIARPMAPAALADFSSASLNPPSGPSITVIACGGW